MNFNIFLTKKWGISLIYGCVSTIYCGNIPCENRLCDLKVGFKRHGFLIIDRSCHDIRRDDQAYMMDRIVDTGAFKHAFQPGVEAAGHAVRQLDIRTVIGDQGESGKSA